MKKKLLLFFILLSGVNLARAQTTTGKSSLPKSSEKETSGQPGQKESDTLSGTREQRAKKQILEMKDGVLLVRLRTQENTIRELEKTNKAQGDALRKAQFRENKRLADAFRANFDFCPVYFFYSTGSEKLLKGETAGILLDQNLKPEPGIILPEGKSIFVAEITNIEPYRPEQDPQQSSSNADISFRALVVRDGQLNQLTSPFPFYIKIQQLMPPRKRTEAELVKELNRELMEFYKLVTGNVK